MQWILTMRSTLKRSKKQPSRCNTPAFESQEPGDLMTLFPSKLATNHPWQLVNSYSLR